ncbi:hypothetical protein AVEN_5155-1 [Araneus ventricosus]|uniref:Uncharacterized protein n=1 Tax=Araneus ventricosus TaxID=182803 RepID=A0A4Y2HRZ9_ARAVE|nr:hypothetical protein AVEN_5155-1 [Araneus ventricosus]
MAKEELRLQNLNRKSHVASPGNGTLDARLRGEHSTTKPPMLIVDAYASFHSPRSFAALEGAEFNELLAVPFRVLGKSSFSFGSPKRTDPCVVFPLGNENRLTLNGTT